MRAIDNNYSAYYAYRTHARTAALSCHAYSNRLLTDGTRLLTFRHLR
jgi:hypothetical protein